MYLEYFSDTFNYYGVLRLHQQSPIIEMRDGMLSLRCQVRYAREWTGESPSWIYSISSSCNSNSKSSGSSSIVVVVVTAAAAEAVVVVVTAEVAVAVVAATTEAVAVG